jgi:UDP-2,3-diacylglucosamine pyrophosphatase LpxH
MKSMGPRRGHRHTIVLSDVHLGEGGADEGEWLEYRQPRYFPDDEFRKLVDVILSKILAGDALDLVFGGDCVEFEATTESDHPRSRPETEDEAIQTLERVTRDHPIFLGALADVIEAGHRVIFVVGNHDAALTFPGVQRALKRAVFDWVEPLSADDPDDLPRRLRVMPWFFQNEDRIHVEHGHQYDSYCSFRDPLRPFEPSGLAIHPTVGSLAFRHLVSRMGYFNPYDDRSFMLSTPRYLLHWVRYYLFTRRSLAVRWFLGAINVVSQVIRHRPSRVLLRAMRAQAAATRTAFALAHGLEPKQLEEHARLFADPADEDPHRMLREFRLDHAALAAIGVAGLITAAFKPRLGLGLALGALAVGIAQEFLVPRAPLSTGYAKVDEAQRKVSEIYQARAVVFGHTHQPHAEIEDGILYANTGSWTPSLDRPDLPKPSTKGRPLVWLRSEQGDPEAPLEGGLYRYRDGELRPDLVIDQQPAEEIVIEAEAVLVKSG